MIELPDLDTSNPRARIRELGRRDEGECVAALLAEVGEPSQSHAAVAENAATLVHAIRRRQHYGANINALLNEYSLSSREGVLLMCLAEALLRVPDKLTADRLIADKLGGGDWGAHLGQSGSLLVNASAWGLLLTGRVVELRSGGGESPLQWLRQIVGRAGEPAIRAAMRLAMQIMGTQFVLGREIGEAIARSVTWQERGYRYTFDMLGEAARTGDYAQEYFDGYCAAIEEVGRTAGSANPVAGPGFSIKLSALHPRYELAHYRRVRDELVPRVLELALLARRHNLGLTIDAEEAHRQDLMLEIFERVFSDHSLRGWEGLGIAVQSYLKSGPAVVDWLVQLGRQHRRKIMVRLVKGAYWDAEIKLAQTLGYECYPVYTRKASSDLAYIVCARRLLSARDSVFPQFATHNAHSVATVLQFAGDVGEYEFQRLHGMGEELYDELIDSRGVPIACRIYAPVGEHRDLLAYLVRRLLENGANSSFVHKLADERIPDRQLVEDPAHKLRAMEHLSNVGIPLPANIYGARRKAAAGIDLADLDRLEQIAAALADWEARIGAAGCRRAEPGALAVHNPANCTEVLGYYVPASEDGMTRQLARAEGAFGDWSDRPAEERAELIRRAADQLEYHCLELAGFCVKEAGKTLRDAIADVREAVDFCRYYADQSRLLFQRGGDAPTPRGVVLCISPWNFPVAIFVGQISAALVAGNTVLAKPAEQTTLTGLRVVQLFHRAGVPGDALQTVLGPGEPIGERLLPDESIAAVMFTGSTEVAHYIARTLAARGGPRVPLIAETGGQNAMVVDSTALLEKVVDDVIASGFNSAGQRCSALRVLFVQEEIAEPLLTMLVGAMKQLEVGDPAVLATDVGPIIDGDALARLRSHVSYMEGRGRLIYQCELPAGTANGHFFAPALYEIEGIEQLPREVFGPVVHLIRYNADTLHTLPAAINSSGYGLTFGVHSRIESTIDLLSSRVQAGNVYVNRNIIGAVVGVQPFGGRGLSGTGPKAGGPFYLERLVKRPLRDIALALPPSLPAANVPAASTGDWPGLIAELAAAFDTWSETPMDRRLACAARLGDAIVQEKQGGDHGPGTAIGNLIEQARQCALPVELNGPTGEANTLRLEGRGVILCLFSHDTPCGVVLVRVMTALLAGSTVLIAGTCPAATVAAARGLLVAAGFPPESVSVAHGARREGLERLIREAPIAGVAVVAGESAASLLASRALARREGAILPLLDEPLGPGALSRFFYEKAVAINTTASGGNAALMSQGELD